MKFRRPRLLALFCVDNVAKAAESVLGYSPQCVERGRPPGFAPLGARD
jgi:hypothetical protein